jgi:undecaprenyl-diphosphatase
MADWLNTVFYALDSGAFSFTNSLAQVMGGFLTPLSQVMAMLGKGGIFFIVLSIALMLFRKTRKTGFTMLLAIGVGALFTNVIIKNAVARPRPYTVDEFKNIWAFVGSHTESEFSFPSGHATVTTTAMMALFLTTNKKWSWLGFVFALIVGFTRVYLVVHYFTDVLAGFIVGAVSGTIAYFLSKWIYKIISNNQEKKFCSFVLGADLINLFKKEK